MYDQLQDFFSGFNEFSEMKIAISLVYAVIVLSSIILIPNAFAENVPDWVKNTAGWWATDIISETEFVNAIAYLIKVGIITLEKECKFEGEEFSHLKFHYQIGSIDEERNATGKFSAIDLLCQNIDLTFIDEFTSAKTSN